MATYTRRVWSGYRMYQVREKCSRLHTINIAIKLESRDYTEVHLSKGNYVRNQ